MARGAKGNFEDLDAALSQDYLVGGKLTLADLAVRGCFSRLSSKGDFHSIYCHLRVIFTYILSLKDDFHLVYCHIRAFDSLYMVI